MGNNLGSLSKHIPQDIPEDNGVRFLERCLPHEVLCHILSFVPAKDLVLSVNRVCRYWNELLSENHFWFTKLQVDGFILTESSREQIAKQDVAQARHILQLLCVRRPSFNINLIKNPSGVDGFCHWKVRHGGDGIIIEDNPAGSDPIPEEIGLPSQHCFVTSYGMCTRKQELDLNMFGFSPIVLDLLKPKIIISEWVSARWDCRSQASLLVELEGDSNQTRELSWSSEDEGVCHRLWYELKLVLTDYPKGLKRIVYTSAGKDRQFWAGHYGAKSAGSLVKIVY